MAEPSQDQGGGPVGPPPLRMYILIRESVPLGFAMVGAAHASMAAYLKFKEHPETVEWVSGVFAKVICKVTDAELERAQRDVADHVVLTESGWGGQVVSVAFRPRREWPKAFRFLKLYR